MENLIKMINFSVIRNVFQATTRVAAIYRLSYCYRLNL